MPSAAPELAGRRGHDLVHRLRDGRELDRREPVPGRLGRSHHRRRQERRVGGQKDEAGRSEHAGEVRDLGRDHREVERRERVARMVLDGRRSRRDLLGEERRQHAGGCVGGHARRPFDRDADRIGGAVGLGRLHDLGRLDDTRPARPAARARGPRRSRQARPARSPRSRTRRAAGTTRRSCPSRARGFRRRRRPGARSLGRWSAQHAPRALPRRPRAGRRRSCRPRRDRARPCHSPPGRAPHRGRSRRGSPPRPRPRTAP